MGLIAPHAREFLLYWGRVAAQGHAIWVIDHAGLWNLGPLGRAGVVELGRLTDREPEPRIKHVIASTALVRAHLINLPAVIHDANKARWRRAIAMEAPAEAGISGAVQLIQCQGDGIRTDAVSQRAILL